MIWRRVACLGAVTVVAAIVVTSVGESWGLIFPLIFGFLMVGVFLACLPMPRGAMISLAVLPWSAIIGSSKIHFPLGASVVIFRESGDPTLLLCIYSVVVLSNLICLWDAFTPPTHAVPRIATRSLVALSIMAIGYIHHGPSWLAISVTDLIILALLDPRTEPSFAKYDNHSGT